MPIVSRQMQHNPQKSKQMMEQQADMSSRNDIEKVI